jgi:hypothetical protein
MIPQVLGDDRSGGHGDVVLFAEVAGLEMRVPESKEPKTLAPSYDAFDRRAPFDDRRRAALELVQETALREAIDLLVIEDLDLDVAASP